MEPKNKRAEIDPKKLKKGQLLMVKVPPFYDKEYLYQISGAGGKLIRATLFHSPTVKKQWTLDDLELLLGNDMIRFVDEATTSGGVANANSSDNDTADEPTAFEVSDFTVDKFIEE